MFRWERLIAHSHWLTIQAFGRELHLCARCSGTVLGFTSSKVFLSILSTIPHFPVQIAYIVAVLFAVPMIFDWTAQSLGLRQSNNKMRLTTGFFEGVGIIFLSLAETSPFVKLISFSALGLTVFVAGILGHKIVKKINR